METPTPEDPPGARNLVRIFLDTLRVHLTALEADGALFAELTPNRWGGKASDAFDDGLRKFDAESEKITELHRLATDRVTGYHTFIQNLPPLWSAYADEPAERARLVGLYQDATDRLAAELLGWAAQLDALGHVNLGDLGPVTFPDREPAEHVLGLAALEPEPVQPRSGDTTQDHGAGLRGATALFSRSYEGAYELREQIVVGQRQERISWAA